MSEENDFEMWKAKLDELEQKEKVEDMKDKVRAKERDLKLRNLRKGWKNLKGMFGK